MNTKEKTPSKIIEIELQIKLLDYLKVNNFINDEMYNIIANKLIKKLSNEKGKTNDIYDYKLGT